MRRTWLPSPRAPLALLLLLTVLASAAPARAEGELVLRGNYWRDRNTRVIAPEVTVRKTAPSGTTIEAGYLLDVISSASAASGGSGGGDAIFTELRNEAGARVSQDIGPAQLSVLYRYSTESDYWAHTAGGSARVELFEKNFTLVLNYIYSHSEAARRVSALGYVWANKDRQGSTLETSYVSLTASHVLARWALLSASFDFFNQDGYQANPYRTALVSGTAMREVVPDLRQRFAGTVTARLAALHHRGVVDHLAFYLSYRLYGDTWSLIAHTAEARAYLGLGPTELRLTVRGYTQTGAFFWKDSYSKGAAGDHCPTDGGCYTGDPKLAPLDSLFLELRFALELKALFGTRVGLARWIGPGVLGISAGHYWNDGAAQRTFGDAWVGGLDLTLPM